MTRFEIATSAMVMPVGTSPRVREELRIVILTQEFPHEGPDLGRCLADILRRYDATDRDLCSDCHRWRSDNGPGHRHGSDDQHQEVKKIIEEPCEEEVEKILLEPNEFS